ncbi:MAG: hypothetical protein NEHIOOID_00722 [Holosporales bacterium]
MIKFLLWILITPLWADIQKNKKVESFVKIENNGKDIRVDVEPLLSTPDGLSTLIDIFVLRYEKIKIDGFLVLDSKMESVGKAVSDHKSLNKKVYHLSDQKDIPKGQYILMIDVLDDGEKIEKIIQGLALKGILVLELACITEILKSKAREKIQAQVMSVFLSRKTQ